MQADKNLKLHQMGKFQGKAQKRLGTKAQQRTGRQRGEHTALKIHKGGQVTKTQVKLMRVIPKNTGKEQQQEV